MNSSQENHTETENESTCFPGEPEQAFYKMITFFDELKVGRKEVKCCPEKDCKYASSNKSDLKDHFNSRHIHFSAFKCELCNEDFYTRRNYNRHRKMRHKQQLIDAAINVGILKRPREETQDKAREEFSKLAIPATNESVIFQGNPKEAYEAMSLYFKRLKICKQQLIKCPEKNCQYTCNNKTDLKGHLNSRHIHYLSIQCDLCDELFYTQKALHSHKKNRHGVNIVTKSSKSSTDCLASLVEEIENDHDDEHEYSHDSECCLSGTSTPQLTSVASNDNLSDMEKEFNPNEFILNEIVNSNSTSTPVITFQPELVQPKVESKIESYDDIFSEVEYPDSFDELSDIGETYSKEYLENDCEIEWKGNWIVG